MESDIEADDTDDNIHEYDKLETSTEDKMNRASSSTQKVMTRPAVVK